MPQKRTVRVLWPVDSINPNSVPATIAGVRFAKIARSKRSELQRLLEIGHNQQSKKALAKYLDRFVPDDIYAETAVKVEDPAKAQEEGRRRLREVVELVNFSPASAKAGATVPPSEVTSAVRP